MPITDVTYVADAHAALLWPGLGPRRYILVGHTPSFRHMIARLRELAERNIWSIPIPAAMAPAAGRAAGWARVKLGASPSLSHEGPWLVPNANEADSTPATDDFGLDFTPLDTTLADTVKWLYETGHITSRRAGTFAS